MKVGDYARADFEMLNIQRICKIIKIISDDFFNTDIGYFDKENMKKSSSDITSLIYAGDYVNGHKVIYTIGENPKKIYIEYGNMKELLEIKSEQIKSIVTKEQFENMEYKL